MDRNKLKFESNTVYLDPFCLLCHMSKCWVSRCMQYVQMMFAVTSSTLWRVYTLMIFYFVWNSATIICTHFMHFLIFKLHSNRNYVHTILIWFWIYTVWWTVWLYQGFSLPWFFFYLYLLFIFILSSNTSLLLSTVQHAGQFTCRYIVPLLNCLFTHIYFSKYCLFFVFVWT